MPLLEPQKSRRKHQHFYIALNWEFGLSRNILGPYFIEDEGEYVVPVTSDWYAVMIEELLHSEEFVTEFSRLQYAGYRFNRIERQPKPLTHLYDR